MEGNRLCYNERGNIQNSENIGFTKAMNQAISMSKGKYVFQLNPDTKLIEDSISKIHNFFQ